MKTFSSIMRPYLKGAVLVTLTVGIFELLSGVILFSLVDVGFGKQYAENLVIASLFKTEITRKSAYIFMGLGMVALMGALSFSVYFSHKIAGPLIRMRYFSRDMADGCFDMKVVFRQGDAVHALALSANQCAEWYQGKYKEIMHAVDELEDTVQLLDESARSGDAESIAVQSGKLDRVAHTLAEAVSEIKV